jgi:hypothetical protein
LPRFTGIVDLVPDAPPLTALTAAISDAN